MSGGARTDDGDATQRAERYQWTKAVNKSYHDDDDGDATQKASTTATKQNTFITANNAARRW